MADLDWKMVGVIVTVWLASNALLIGAIKFLIERAVKSFDDNMAGLKAGQRRTDERIEVLEREFRDLLTQLPNIYVQREDWIRFVVGFESKLDRLGDKLDKVRESIGK